MCMNATTLKTHSKIHKLGTPACVHTHTGDGSGRTILCTMISLHTEVVWCGSLGPKSQELANHSLVDKQGHSRTLQLVQESIKFPHSVGSIFHTG